MAKKDPETIPDLPTYFCYDRKAGYLGSIIFLILGALLIYPFPSNERLDLFQKVVAGAFGVFLILLGLTVLLRTFTKVPLLSFLKEGIAKKHSFFLGKPKYILPWKHIDSVHTELVSEKVRRMAFSTPYIHLEIKSAEDFWQKHPELYKGWKNKTAPGQEKNIHQRSFAVNTITSTKPVHLVKIMRHYIKE